MCLKMRFIKMLIMLFVVYLTIIQFVDSGCDTGKPNDPNVLEVKLNGDSQSFELPKLNIPIPKLRNDQSSG
uniref:Smp_203090 n=1 Tax=Schistosoma mansoni TaxID=6183 RepID=A0A3Q0KUW0_SCHMA